MRSSKENRNSSDRNHVKQVLTSYTEAPGDFEIGFMGLAKDAPNGK